MDDKKKNDDSHLQKMRDVFAIQEELGSKERVEYEKKKSDKEKEYNNEYWRLKDIATRIFVDYLRSAADFIKPILYGYKYKKGEKEKLLAEARKAMITYLEAEIKVFLHEARNSDKEKEIAHSLEEVATYRDSIETLQNLIKKSDGKPPIS